MSDLWDLADRLEVVPHEPDPVLRSRFETWRSQPPQVGCPHVTMADTFIVVWPDPTIRCAQCSRHRFAVERRCIYCCDESVEVGDRSIVHEGGGVVILSRAHSTCAEEAP